MISKTAAPSNRQHTSRASRDTDSSHLFSTKNDIPADARSRIAELLNRRLADCIDLQTQCKQAHWNVKGPSFIGLHKLFDDINTDVEEYVDLLAERLVQLGGVAEGTARCVAERSTLREYPLEISSGQDHVEALSTALASFGRGCREGIDQLDELGDADGADILTEISRGVDKWLWFVEAHQQEGAGPAGR
ncbi:MAG: DNA starvation/stationary phase protection protein Dps [Gemmatimonadales bacterium]